jgi:hypothetical protein
MHNPALPAGSVVYAAPVLLASSSLSAMSLSVTRSLTWSSSFDKTMVSLADQSVRSLWYQIKKSFLRPYPCDTGAL